jgi:peptidoglycan/xylan/chitin deacetylase (PgdA/CDA1 family)
MRRTAALTFDLHASDRAEDILACAQWLERHALPATFFIPTALLDEPGFEPALRAIDNGLNDLGTHGHKHDIAEMTALKSADPGPQDLDFLDLSAELFQRFFGRSARVFRSPTWCYVNHPAALRLSELGYTVDSSATPQRPGLLSSHPWENPWLFSQRSPYYRTPSLLEIPTSCMLLPLNRTAFSLLRMPGTLAFVSLFMAEASLFPERSVVMQLHPDDLVPTAQDEPRSFRLRDLLPLRGSGIVARYWLIDTNRHRSVARTIGACDALGVAGFEFLTLSQIHDRQQPALKAQRP